MVGNVNAPGAADVLDGRDAFPGPNVLDVLDVFDVVDVSKGSGLR
ncbi:hypothetical protein ACWF76_16690 [Streptomyces globisporus]|nr:MULTISPECIES: hypothetical protein [Streptomyces]